LAKTLRVHNLAKELGVKSKEIVAKCEAEEVPGITNHMSVVKLGLAETIRNWFPSDGEDESHDASAEEGGGTATAVKPAAKPAVKTAAQSDADTTSAAGGARARKRAAPKAKPKRMKPT